MQCAAGSVSQPAMCLTRCSYRGFHPRHRGLDELALAMALFGNTTNCNDDTALIALFVTAEESHRQQLPTV